MSQRVSMILPIRALDCIISSSLKLCLPAFVCVALAMAGFIADSVGAVSFAVFSATLVAACARSYKSERGVWMLLALFAFMSLAMFGGIGWSIRINVASHGFDWHRVGLDGSLFGGTAIVGWVTISAAIWNWRLTRGAPPIDEPPEGAPVPAPLNPAPPALSAAAEPDRVFT